MGIDHDVDFIANGVSNIFDPVGDSVYSASFDGSESLCLQFEGTFWRFGVPVGSDSISNFSAE